MPDPEGPVLILDRTDVEVINFLIHRYVLYAKGSQRDWVDRIQETLHACGNVHAHEVEERLLNLTSRVGEFAVRHLTTHPRSSFPVRQRTGPEESGDA